MPNPDGSPTATERAAQVAAANAAKSAGGTTDTTVLTQWLKDNGINMPTTKADFMAVAAELYKQKSQLDAWEQNINSYGSSGIAAQGNQIAYDAASDKAMTVQNQLLSMAAELHYGTGGEAAGTGGSGSVAQDVSYVLKPPTPNIAKLPTAEAFLGDYQNAFATHISGLQSSGQLTSQEAKFATDQLQSEYLQKYTGKLGPVSYTHLTLPTILLV